MTESECSRIADALSYLQMIRPSVFGGDFHGFRMNPPLAEDEVGAFEQRFSVRLPSDFREFLTEIGNGGAGPFYGILPLGVVDHNMGFRAWHEGDELVGIPSKPFKFEEDWNDVDGMPPVDLRDETEYWNRMDEFESIYWGASLVDGSIPICHEGCALRVLLVLTGDQAGLLWEDRRSEYKGLRRVRLADGSPASFGQWYREWLNACLLVSKLPIS